MRIGLLSDAHIPHSAPRLPDEVEHALRGVDLILHAGDILHSSTLDQLERIAPVLAARGDDDKGEVLSDNRVKWKHMLKLHGRPYGSSTKYHTRTQSLTGRPGGPRLVE
jgi:putative phosphoesterase